MKDDALSRRDVSDARKTRWRQLLEGRPPAHPDTLVLGVNYSGMHDSAVALIANTGEVLFASSLERVSRIKQDGRPPDPLLADLPWDAIGTVAVSTDEQAWQPAVPTSMLHPQPLRTPRTDVVAHGQPFYDYLGHLPATKTYVCHQLSHAASAFWLSGLDEALCLTYDGGMWNSPWFGGLYRASRSEGITPLDRFPASHYAKITSLYSMVTAVLGFSPNKHEGKVTGLAAFGRPTSGCRDVLQELFRSDYFEMESAAEWIDMYSQCTSPTLAVDPERREALRRRFEGISREDLAATLQEMTEEHVLEILYRARQHGWDSPGICLAGGLFANVKLNQRLRECGFRTVFVAPAMTDDGTAVGAALAVASSSRDFAPVAVPHVFWGPGFGPSETEQALTHYGLSYRQETNAADVISDYLREGLVVGLFQGRMEFGPRALGNRSILSQATDPDCNSSLNARLRRTEFMPFAPVTRAEDVPFYYKDLSGAEHAASFMTITCACTDEMRRDVPAVVHVDGTARPQIVTRDVHPLLHGILTKYKERTGLSAVINTSFNVHEEPIVCSPADAIRGFLEAGLDVLYLEGGYVVELRDNAGAAATYLRRRLGEPTDKERHLATVNDHLYDLATKQARDLEAKQAWALDLLRIAEERAASMLEKEQVIGELAAEVTRLRKDRGDG